MASVTLVTGGARSGKSARALRCAESTEGSSYVFIATAMVTDEEMRQRIDQHRKERSSQWRTLETPLDLAGTFDGIQPRSVVLVDCLTVWLGNLWHEFKGDETRINQEIDTLALAITDWKSRDGGALYLVTNEVGWGIVPLDPGVRVFRDCAGRLNKTIAAIADTVELCVCGLPVTIK